MGTRIKFFAYHTLFWLFIVVYVLTLYLKYFISEQSFLNSHLADLLCMPIVFYLVQEIFVRFKINGGLSAFKILIGVLYFSFLFEFLLPQFSPKFTADWLDVLMYFLGGVIYFLLKITLKPSNKTS